MVLRFTMESVRSYQSPICPGSCPSAMVHISMRMTSSQEIPTAPRRSLQTGVAAMPFSSVELCSVIRAAQVCGRSMPCDNNQYWLSGYDSDLYTDRGCEGCVQSQLCNNEPQPQATGEKQRKAKATRGNQRRPIR